MANEKTDRRIQRTRQLMQNALVALIAEKGYEKVTIQDIIDRANVGRSTFYAHYRDKEDLLLRGVAEIAYGDEVDEQVAKDMKRRNIAGASGTLTTLPMLMHVQQNRQIHEAMFKQSNENAILEKGTAYLYANIKAQLTEILGKDQEATVPLSLLARYLTGGLIEMTKWWLENNMQLSPKELDELFQKIALPGVLGTLGKK
jgi:AcrR family transcriptional regulator